MPGTITFRPVEANITHDTNWLGKMDPYCMFSIGTQRVKSSVCRHGGTRPHWGDTVSLNSTGFTAGTANIVRLEIFDKDRFRPDDHIAYTDIDLNEIEQTGSVAKWYPLFHHRKPAGEILVEAAVQQQQMFVQSTVPVTTYVQETVMSSAPVDTLVGESYVVGGPSTYTQGMPLQSGLSYGQTTSYATTTNVPITTTTATNIGSYGTPLANNTNPLQPGFASKVSALGPSGGIPHGHHTVKDAVNVGYAGRPGYTLGDTEANPTCQSNLDSNGGGFFNKPNRERRAEPYAHSMPGTYGIPHGMTLDTAGQVVPNVAMERPAPIGTVTHPGVTGYVDGFNNKSGLNQPGYGQGSYGTGLNSGFNQQGLSSYDTGLNQAGSYGTGLNTGLNQAGSYGTGLNTGLSQPGAYTSGLGTGFGQQGLGQGSYTSGLNQQNLAQGNLISSLGGQQGLTTQQGLSQPGLGQGSIGTGLNNQTNFGGQF